jgi:hypothetical protein
MESKFSIIFRNKKITIIVGIILILSIAGTVTLFFMRDKGNNHHEPILPPTATPAATSSTSSTPTPSPTPVPTSIAISFETITDSSLLSEDFLTEIGELKFTKGYLLYEEEEYSYLIITMGEQPSSGYDVIATRVEKYEDMDLISVTVKEVIPDKDQQVVNVKTYPYTIIKLVVDTNTIAVKTQNGVQYKNHR